MDDEHRRIVQDGYDSIAEVYDADRRIYYEHKLFNQFLSYVPENGRILDLGCGSGVVLSRILSVGRYKVTGIDISEKMLEIARVNVPLASFKKMDMTNLQFEDSTFDGVLSTYALFHVNRLKHQSIFSDVNRILKPDGVLLVSVAMSECEEIADFYGVDMFWSHYGREEYVAMVEKSGFVITMAEPFSILDDETHFWILAKKQQE